MHHNNFKSSNIMITIKQMVLCLVLIGPYFIQLFPAEDAKDNQPLLHTLPHRRLIENAIEFDRRYKSRLDLYLQGGTVLRYTYDPIHVDRIIILEPLNSDF